MKKLLNHWISDNANYIERLSAKNKATVTQMHMRSSFSNTHLTHIDLMSHVYTYNINDNNK